MDNPRINVDTRDGIGRVTLCRPEAANAIDLLFAQEFEHAASQCLDHQVRAVLISAEGSQFCAGGDVKSFSRQPDIPKHLSEVTRHLHEGISTFVEMNAPVVVAVQGAAAGAGLGLVCAADLAIASNSATFLMAYTALGLSPDASSSWFLARHVGLHRAIDLTLTNRVLSAEDALSWGLVTRVVSDEELHTASEDLVSTLALGPTSAFGASIRLLTAAADESFVQHLAAEAQSIAALSESFDGSEGIAAFIQRRTAHFEGPTQIDDDRFE